MKNNSPMTSSNGPIKSQNRRLIKLQETVIHVVPPCKQNGRLFQLFIDVIVTRYGKISAVSVLIVDRIELV